MLKYINNNIMDNRPILFGKDVNSGKITQLKSHSNTLLMNSASTPIGSITQYAGSTAPTGWIICDGSAINRTTYSDLFSVIGTTYGVGNGSTTFNIPDLRTRVPIGLNNTGTFTSLGGTGGTETETLALNQIPSHNHNLFNAASTWPTGINTGPSINIVSSSGSSTWGVYSSASWSGSYYDTALVGSAAAAASITGGISSTTGGGGSHNNLQPYIILNYIIYTGVNLFINLTSDISGVIITTPSDTQIIRYNGSNWVNQKLLINDISGVIITTPSNGQTIKYNGSNWVNQNISFSDISGISFSGCNNGYIVGGSSSWSALAPATDTSGTAFVITNPGNYVMNVSASAYISTIGLINIYVWIDRVNMTTLKGNSNEANSHKTLVPISFKIFLTAGTHYFYLQQFTGTADASDFASFNWIYTP